MSLIAARKKRTNLYLAVAGLMVMVAAVSAISARDPSGVSLRIGMIMITVGAALWLDWRQLIPAVVLAWLVPNLGRSFVNDTALGGLNMLLELPGLAGVGFFAWMARDALKRLEQENVLIGTGSSDLAGLNPETGIFDANQLRPALSVELARSRRFGRTFSLVLVGLDEKRQKFDYRDDSLWKASQDATTRLLRETRFNVDRVFHYKEGGYAILLPETSEKEVPGLVKRLRRLARSMKPAEGEQGGPLPVHFGATFFPDCATTIDDLLRRAEVALRIAASNTSRYQLDSAEAPELPPAESLRREAAARMNGVAAAPRAPGTAPAAPAAAAVATFDPAYVERVQEFVSPGSTATSPDGASEARDPEDVEALEPAAVWITDTSGAAGIANTAAEPVLLATPDASEALSEARSTGLEAPLGESNGVEASPRPPADDFESLLAQMDETLKLIQKVRSHAA